MGVLSGKEAAHGVVCVRKADWYMHIRRQTSLVHLLERALAVSIGNQEVYLRQPAACYIDVEWKDTHTYNTSTSPH